MPQHFIQGLPCSNNDAALSDHEDKRALVIRIPHPTRNHSQRSLSSSQFAMSCCPTSLPLFLDWITQPSHALTQSTDKTILTTLPEQRIGIIICILCALIIIATVLFRTLNTNTKFRHSTSSLNTSQEQQITHAVQNITNSQYKSQCTDHKKLVLSFHIGSQQFQLQILFSEQVTNANQITSLLSSHRITTTPPVFIGNDTWLSKAHLQSRSHGGSPPLRRRSRVKDVLDNPINHKFTSANNTHTHEYVTPPTPPPSCKVFQIAIRNPVEPNITARNLDLDFPHSAAPTRIHVDIIDLLGQTVQTIIYTHHP